MPKFPAARLARVRESGTVRITDLVAKLRKEGRSVVSWSVGEPDFDTPAPVREAAKRALDAGKTHYVSAWGIPELREAVAEKSTRENGIPATSSNVLVAPAKQAIFYAIVGLVDEGDEVLLPDPAWVSYEPLIRLAGGRPVPVPTSAADGWRMRPEAVAARITPRTKMVILNSPSNPTGGVLEPADIRGIADLCRDHDLWLLSDELYEKILYDATHLSPASLPGMAERTLTVNGLSKSHAMTGWRLGWLVAGVPVLKELVKLQQHSLTHPAAFNQYAAVEALRMDPKPVQEMVAEFRARRDLLLEGLRGIPGFDVATPRGAFYVFPRVRWRMGSLEFAERLLLEAGVAVTPGVEFGAAGEGHLRISYATSRENLHEGLRRLRDFAATLPPPA